MSSSSAPLPAPRRFHSQPPRFPRMQMCVNQNNNNDELWTGKRRPKRDFHFQVITLQQHQQYFVWPSKHDENSNKRKQASSSSSSSAYSSVPTTFSSIPSTSSSGPETPKATVTPTMGNGIRRGRFAVQTTKAASPAVVIPSNHRLSDESTVSCSAPSDTFKILSISKNVSFDDESDVEEEELMCSQVVISRRLSSAPPPPNR
ncbi:hypothetical protein PMAYCL1PPCAC_07525 [Pristionchus mayeri]|uniref:Uncharacterized protein n=1 Tax=Pristionchus mayeri TaxID=1317129 RepID=A0AAN4ZGM1_9BILA|nr:hypothetical protein PMAYCL1PPCAC_07525 [Pristionchus mayeri]